ncbi:MAG: hypothetical protein KDD94_01145 [Calditrichaeota bacterium]|nr:hypothetical protein [Calditrichota bacterium]
MILHDHSKLNPLIEKADLAVSKKDFQIFAETVSKCLSELENHIVWENGKSGILHDIEKNYPNLADHVNELRSDHEFFKMKLAKALELAQQNNPDAFVFFERFKLRRKEHLLHEDELDIDAHTVPLE